MISRRFFVSMLMAALLAAVGSAASAQSVIRAGSRVGTIQAIEHGDSFITISGQNYGYSDEVIKVFLDGDPVDQGILQPGMVVRFTLDLDGVVENVDLLGPADMIDEHFEH